MVHLQHTVADRLVENLDASMLPRGWHFEDGYITLDSQVRDHWEFRDGCLIRRHAVPRRTCFDPKHMTAQEQKDMPVPLDKLEQVRVSVQRFGHDAKSKTDSLAKGYGDISAKAWTGYTVFQLTPEAQKAISEKGYGAKAAKKVQLRNSTGPLVPFQEPFVLPSQGPPRITKR